MISIPTLGLIRSLAVVAPTVNYFPSLAKTVVTTPTQFLVGGNMRGFCWQLVVPASNLGLGEIEVWTCVFRTIARYIASAC